MAIKSSKHKGFFSLFNIAEIAFFVQQALTAYPGRGTVSYLLPLIIVLGIPAVLVPWFCKENNICAKAICSLSAVAFTAATVCFTYKISLLAKFIFALLASFAYLVLVRTKNKEYGTESKECDGIFRFELFAVIGVPLLGAFKFSFIESDVPFLLAAVLLGLVLGLAFSFASSRKGIKPAELAGKFLLAAFVCAIVSWGMIANLNYALDFSEPERCTGEITEKDYTNRRKGSDRYEFTLSIDGITFEIEVPSHEYHAHKVGDTYTVNRYEGAFGEPFFVVD